ncbi:MAG: hypothetical protein K5910_09920, partial [Bacteroidales bacterium]|nr:hypothetical protein [Bacteroidales bacterium]
EENKHNEAVRVSEDYIDINLMGMFQRLFKEWKTILKWVVIALVLGIVIAFSLPNEYSVTAKMVPERTASRQGGNMSALASMAGVNLGNAGTADAFSPDLYPLIITSNPFVAELFPVPVEYKAKKQTVSSDYYTYMRDYYRIPWWKSLSRIPSRLIRLVRSVFKGKSEPVVGYDNLDLSRMTSEQNRVASRIRNSLSLKLERNTNVISLTVTAQDPRVAAKVAEEVVARLKDYLIEYRTEKARKNLDYYQTLYADYQKAYYTSQQRYASYVDSHQGVVLQRVRTEQERLQNEMNLNYQLYNSCAQQLQAAQAKVQEETPVFTMINPPMTPLSPSAPSRGLIIFALAFLGALAACFWILFGRNWKNQLKQTEDQEQ